MKPAFMKPAATSADDAIKIVRQLRAVHPALRAPGEHAAIQDAAAPPSLRVTEFLDRLAEWPLTAWLETGRALVDDSSSLHVRHNAREALDAAISSKEWGFAAWSVRDALETLAFLKTRQLCEWLPVQRRYFAAAHGAAEAALLALLVRDHLDDEHFQALVAAFGQCIGAEEVPLSAKKQHHGLTPRLLTDQT